MIRMYTSLFSGRKYHVSDTCAGRGSRSYNISDDVLPFLRDQHLICWKCSSHLAKEVRCDVMLPNSKTERQCVLKKGHIHTHKVPSLTPHRGDNWVCWWDPK